MIQVTPVPFYFLRHGETDWNRQRIMQGQTDIPLNAAGIQQAEEVAPYIAALPIATICCSTLGRARRTAEIVNRNALPIVVIDALKECGFGVYESKKNEGAWREAWKSGAEIPGGETFEGFAARLLGGVNQALSSPGPVLIVGHGGSFWPLERACALQPDIRVGNCSLFRFDPPASGNAWTCVQIAEPASPSIAIGEVAPA